MFFVKNIIRPIPALIFAAALPLLLCLPRQARAQSAPATAPRSTLQSVQQSAPATAPSAKKSALDWGALRNPIYARDGWSVKDACMVRRGESCYLFFSAFFFDRGRERAHLAAVRTTDFRKFSDPLFVRDGRATGWTGLASPDVARSGAEFVLTYNSWGDEHPNGGTNQLFYATSADLENWSAPRSLAPELTRGKRAIDAAFAEFQGKFYLVWKEAQTPQLAFAPDLDGPWQLLGTPPGGWFENAQFLRIDGHWQLLSTGERHEPQLMRMKGGGARERDWLNWEAPRRLKLPVETFNTDHRANAAFLADWRADDGFFYLLYAGRTEGDSHAKRGDNRLGLARSTDLIEWSVPGNSD